MAIIHQLLGAFTSGGLLDGSESDGTQIFTGNASFSTWSFEQTAITAGSTAPDGSSNAVVYYNNNDSNSARHIAYQNPAIASGTLTMSVYAKQKEMQYIQFLIGSSTYLYADLSTGTITDYAASGGFTYVSSSIQAAVNGFYKISFSVSQAGGTYYYHFNLSDRSTHTGSFVSGAPQFAGTHNDGIYMWRPKLTVA